MLILAHAAMLANHAANGSLDDPSTRQDIEARLVFNSASVLDDEVEESSLIHQSLPVIRPVGEEMFDLPPAFAGRIMDRLDAGQVRDVDRGQVNQEQVVVCSDGDVAIAADNLLGRVKAPRLRRWRV